MKLFKIKTVFAAFSVKFLVKILGIEMPVVASATGLAIKDGKMLFVKLSYIKGYGLPGGLAKKNETLEETLEREVFEETGLKIVKMKYFKSYFSNFYGIPTLAALYEISVSGKLKSSKEGTPAWIKPNDVMGELAYFNTKEAVLDYLKIKK
ncbi:MAG: NUDIX hydrolase [Candidatus Woesebacteria bacterium GW2011_GWB1_38_8b]|uniref:NUDIX hydrolase n=1 Tax=Candidatus Woesebacteria bacterium GW2011_GWB1_38_8b TaxID=1618571 RepID=A0A0G0PAI4_9BACT|nr:MAG: NUDIX hydrolase [Candidatus Woesebacteria bacterium GW2011_GWB1_38_8b]